VSGSKTLQGEPSNQVTEFLIRCRSEKKVALVFELKFFGGLAINRTAEMLATHPSTVMRHWMSACLWLFRELERSTVQ
jgi:hypothetical protein